MTTASTAAPQAARNEKFHVNRVDVEGIVTRVYDRRGDVLARLAMYDRFSEVLQPAEDGRLPKRKAHYVTVRFPGGKTADGRAVSLSAKDHVRVSGFLRDDSYSESLRQFLLKAKLVERIDHETDDEVRVGRVATYVIAETLIRFS